MYFSSQGKATRQAHKGIPEGMFEEEQGRKGFFGPVSELIRKRPSTAWKIIEGNLKPRMFDLVKHTQGSKRQRLLYNSDICTYMEWMEPVKTKDLTAYRSADGELVYFCHTGKGKVLTEYGMLPYRPGDYVVIPKCIAHTFFPEEASHFLTIESLCGSLSEPDRGIAGRHAVYDIAQVEQPSLDAQNEFMAKNGIHVLRIDVKHTEEITSYQYEECAFDVVGWHGDFFPYRLNMDQIMPLMSHRAHLPPSAHSTFVAQGFIICSFVPRPLESDADALKVPFYHQNIDFDEVLFYHNGDFFSRANLHPGMMSFHPAGFPHGPHPQAVKKVEGKTFTSEYAVMIDTRKPLMRDPYLNSIELSEYWKSWQS